MHRLALLAVLASSAARADTAVTVQLSQDGRAVAQAMGISEQDLANQIKGRVDDAYRTAEIGSFLREFTDATSFSARGIGVDYASAPKSVIVGLAANLAAAGNPDVHDTQHPTGGLAVNFGLMVGINLSEYEHPRWTVFANGFYQRGSLGDLDGSITSAGAHVQYNLIQPQTGGGAAGTALKWIGVSLTSGIEYTRWSFGTGGTTLSTDFDISGGGMSQAVTLDSTGRFDLRSNTVTVPIEITTGTRIALISTVYVGAGIDLTAGSSTVAASLDGHLHTSDNRDLGTVAITGNGDHSGSPGAVRLLAGGQVNLWKLKIFAQANVSQTPAVSVAVGLKFVQ